MRRKRKQRITIELVVAEQDEKKAVEYVLKNINELYESGRLHVKIESIEREQLLRELIADITAHG